MNSEQTRATDLLDRAKERIVQFQSQHGEVIDGYNQMLADLDDATQLVKTQFRTEPGTSAVTMYYEIKVSKPIESITYDVDAFSAEYPSIARQAVVEIVDKAKLGALIKQGAISSVEASKFAKVEKRAPSVTIKPLTKDGDE